MYTTFTSVPFRKEYNRNTIPLKSLNYQKWMDNACLQCFFLMLAEVHYFYFKIQWLFIFTSPSIIDADICGIYTLGFHTHVNCSASYFSQGDHLLYHFFTTAWFRFIQISIYGCLSTASIFSMPLCFMRWSS